METTKTSTGKIALSYGIVLGLISVTLAVILYITNNLLDQNWITSLIGFLILIGVIIYALKTFKKANGGFMSLSEALKVGVGVAVIGGLIGALYNYIFMTFIEPDFINQIAEVQRTAILERSPNMTDDQLEQSMVMVKRFSQPWISSAIQLIAGLFFGFIISLIAGLVMKRENPYQD